MLMIAQRSVNFCTDLGIDAEYSTPVKFDLLQPVTPQLDAAERQVAPTRRYIRQQDDILRSLDARKHAVLVLLGLNAAFSAPNNRVPQPPPLPIVICGCNVSTSANILDLDVQLDSTTSMAAHVSRSCRTLVTSRLDFGNAALYGITGTLLHRLEMVQRSAERVVLCLRRRDQHSTTTAPRELHWLPVVSRIQFKLLTLMHGAVHANTPRYLADRISPYVPCRSLRSADQSLIVVPMLDGLVEKIGYSQPVDIEELGSWNKIDCSQPSDREELGSWNKIDWSHPTDREELFSWNKIDCSQPSDREELFSWNKID
ncbi:hypothetical protein LSAT2_023712 [Lamellibrachia satsuma]|nr:hypothetical protein LSAT2_023712 [Lamellibrachia satsuma]